VDVSTPLDALQVIVNEYLPGQGINAHVDDPVKFGAWVITVSLGSACEMEFASKKTGAKFRATLPPRSMYAMTGESRYQWTHAIAGRKTDPSPAGSHRVPRSTRGSITFRAKA
jgi:alkylated DNA repair dioxygenase AlkB